MMTSIFDCKEYTDKTWPAYQVDNARYGRPADTIIYFFLYTPTGRVSKTYWAAYRMHYACRNKPKMLEHYIRDWRPSLTGKKKGYRWSKAYLYSGNPEEWKDWKEPTEGETNDTERVA